MYKIHKKERKLFLKIKEFITRFSQFYDTIKKMKSDGRPQP